MLAEHQENDFILPNGKHRIVKSLTFSTNLKLSHVVYHTPGNSMIQLNKAIF